MSPSDRLSGRVDDVSGFELVRGHAEASKGADGGVPASSQYRRVSRRRLKELRQSLAERDLEILRSVEALHYLTTRQLERLHFHGSGLTPPAASRGARRVLARLHEQGLLDRPFGHYTFMATTPTSKSSGSSPRSGAMGDSARAVIMVSRRGVHHRPDARRRDGRGRPLAAAPRAGT